MQAIRERRSLSSRKGDSMVDSVLDNLIREGLIDQEMPSMTLAINQFMRYPVIMTGRLVHNMKGLQDQVGGLQEEFTKEMAACIRHFGTYEERILALDRNGDVFQERIDKRKMEYHSLRKQVEDQGEEIDILKGQIASFGSIVERLQKQVLPLFLFGL
jgi:hypothetical protein